MGYEWLLVVPLLFGTGFAVARSAKNIGLKIMFHLLTLTLTFVFVFVFPGLMKLKMIKSKPYVKIEWEGGTRAVKAKEKFMAFIEKQMKKNGVVIYESTGY